MRWTPLTDKYTAVIQRMVQECIEQGVEAPSEIVIPLAVFDSVGLEHGHPLTARGDRLSIHTPKGRIEIKAAETERPRAEFHPTDRGGK